MKIIVLGLLLSSATASARPDHCGELAAKSFARLAPIAQDKLSDGERFEHVVQFRRLYITVNLDRAPHIARHILLECPGVSVLEASPVDARHFQSELRIRVDSFAALTRVVQIPAVTYVSISDPSVLKPMPPPHRIPEPFLE